MQKQNGKRALNCSWHTEKNINKLGGIKRTLMLFIYVELGKHGQHKNEKQK